jgi:hypothetical protein
MYNVLHIYQKQHLMSEYILSMLHCSLLEWISGRCKVNMVALRFREYAVALMAFGLHVAGVMLHLWIFCDKRIQNCGW